jgi:hypothetical protein
VAGVRVRLAGRKTRTNARGRGSLRIRVNRARKHRVVAKKSGYRSARARVRYFRP